MMGGGADSVIQAMRDYHGSLVTQRSTLESQISSIEGALNTMGASTGGGMSGRRGRPAGRRGGARKRRGPGRPAGRGMREGSLKDSILKVLRQRSRPMTPREIATAVKSSGYKTKSADLTKAVSNALPGMTMVGKAGRGLYRT